MWNQKQRTQIVRMAVASMALALTSVGHAADETSILENRFLTCSGEASNASFEVHVHVQTPIVYGSPSPFKYIVLTSLLEVEKATVISSGNLFEQKIKVETVRSKRLDRRPLISFEGSDYTVSLNLSVNTSEASNSKGQRKLVVEGGESFKDISGKVALGSVYCVLYTKGLAERAKAQAE